MVANGDGTETEVVGGKDFHDQYELGLKIGRGAFAQVRVAIPTDGKSSSKAADSVTSQVAVKIMDLRDRHNPQTINQQLDIAVHHESAVWTTLGSHPNCVKLHDVYFSGVLCFMVMERCSSDLLRHLERVPSLTERHYGRIFRQMLLGIAHVHSCKIIHRDIKPDNFLIGADGVTLKLCDFGLSTLFSEKMKCGVNGTAPFMCPEMLKCQPYDYKADIWSFGVIAYACFYGAFPYMPKEATSKAMKQAIVEGATPKFEPVGRPVQNSHYRTDSAVAFVTSMLTRDPQARPTAVDELQMEFMLAVQEERHAPDIELPSLHNMMLAAKKAGAFENRNPSKEDDIDNLLNQQQMQKCGKPIPTPENKVRLTDAAPTSAKPKRSKVASWDDASASTASPIASTPQSASETSSTSVYFTKSMWSRATDQLSL